MTAPNGETRLVANAEQGRLGEMACGTLVAGALACLVLRQIIFEPGIPLYDDLTFAARLEDYVPRLSSVWDTGRSMQTPFFLQWPLYEPLSLLRGPSTPWIKGILLGSVWLAGAGAFLLSRHLLLHRPVLERIAGSMVAMLVYVLNPWMYRVTVGYLNLLVGYALAPFIILCWIRAVKARQGAGHLAWATLGGLLLGFATVDIRNLLFLLILGFVTGSVAFLVGAPRREPLRAAARATALMGAWTGLFLLPSVLAIGSGSSINRLGLTTLPLLSSRASVVNVLRLGGYWNKTGLDVTLDGPGVATFTSFLPVTLAFGALLFRRPSRLTVALSAGAVTFIALSAGPNGPTGRAFLWLVSSSPFAGVGNVLREPPKTAGTAALCVMLLCSFSTANIVSSSTRVGRRRIPVGLMAVVAGIAAALYSMGPMIGGELTVAFPRSQNVASARSHPYPALYTDAAAYVKRECAPAKTIWMPFDFGQFGYKWNGGSTVSDFHWLNVDAPGMVPTSAHNSKILWYWYYRGLLGGESNLLGTRLSSIGIRCVGFHNDYIPQRVIAGDTPVSVREALDRQRDLYVAYEKTTEAGSVRIYRVSEPAPPPLRRGAFAFAGLGIDETLRTSPVASLRGALPIFPQQGLVPGPSLEPGSDDLLVVENDGWMDMVTSGLRSDEFLPQRERIGTSNVDYLKGWTDWSVLGEGGFEAYFNSEGWRDRFDFVFSSEWNAGQLFAASGKENDSMTESVKAPVNEPLVLLVRYAVETKGGRLLVGVGADTKVVSTAVRGRHGMRWVVVPISPSNEATRIVTIKNVDGATLVGATALITSERLSELESRARRMLDEATGRTAWFANLAKDASRPVSMRLPAGDYDVYTRSVAMESYGVTGKPGAVTLRVSHLPSSYPVIPDGMWRHSGGLSVPRPMAVEASADGSVELQVVPTFLATEPTASGVASTAPRTASSGSFRVVASRPSWFVWNERFDKAWRCSVDGTPTARTPVLSIAVGCRVPAGQHLLEVSHGGSARYSIGRRASVVVLALSSFAAMVSLSVIGVRAVRARRGQGRW